MDAISRNTPIRLISRLSLLAALAAGLAAAATGPTSGASPDSPDNRPITYSGSVAFGAYDPWGDFANDREVKIEALFLPWQDVDLTTLQAADDYARQRGRSLLITVEPWTWSKTEHITAPALLRGILTGEYDGNIAAICDIAGKFQTPTTIRWGQEMEDPLLRFSWQGWTGAEYKSAYQYFVDHCRITGRRLKFMWSPMGLPGLEKYYPGNSYVDTIGLSVFGLQRYDRDNFGHDRDFAAALKPGYDLAARFNKPICVAELGYFGDAAYVRNWASGALKPNPRFPKLDCVVYFNDKEVARWPSNYGSPNWRVTSNVKP